LADPAAVPEPVAVAHGRLVITGAAGHRLHEEVVTAAIRLRRDGGTPRLNVGDAATALAAARPDSVPDPLRSRLAARLDDSRETLLLGLEVRARERAASLEQRLVDRLEEEVSAIDTVLRELDESIRAELEREPDPQLQLFNPAEREQFERDAGALRRRLERIPADIEQETAAVRRRYADPQPRLFPAAISLLVPAAGRLA